LTEAGANARLLRDSDIYLGLYARPEAANMMNADLLVGIHNNSGETATSRGTEVLYYTKEGEGSYGLASKDVATMVQKELVAEIGLPDRGIHSRPQLAVLNKSLMPAIIIEGGFLSNREDLSVMLTADFLEDYAIGVARGIINVLNASVEE
jgi:N-acetylmuramoyl-L-alanine amidase